MMRRSSLGLFFVLAVVFGYSTVHAQPHNVGYYEFESYDGNDTIYRLVFSLHIEGVENEPSMPGDIPVTWGGGDPNCDDDSGTGTAPPDCLDLLRRERLIATHGVGDIIGTVADRIRVVGRRLIFQQALVFLRDAGTIDFEPNIGDLRPVTALEEPSDEEPEECTSAGIGDMNGLLTPAQQELIADFLNSAAAESLWRDSGFEMPFINQQSRQEQAGFLFPNGTFVKSNWNPGPCGGGDPLVPPTNMPPGTIMVHTHPYSTNEPLSHCGDPNPYRNQPSASDVDLVHANSMIPLGLIIDADGIIVFTGNYDPIDSPGESHHKGGDKGECGVARN
jgi:hypothetical protein